MIVKPLEGVGIKEGKYVSIVGKEALAGKLIEYSAELKDGEVEYVTVLIGTHVADLSSFFEDDETAESLLSFLQLIRVYQADARRAEEE